MAIDMEQVAEAARWTKATERSDMYPGEDVSCRLDSLLQADSSARARRITLLSRIVETEILPRLARSSQRGSTVHAGTGCAAASAKKTCTDKTTTDDDTTELVRLLLTHEAADAIDFITRLSRRGVTPAALYLGIMTQAARQLDQLWDDDRCDFAQLTISMGRLQLLVRALSPQFQRAAIWRARAETVLLLPAPGDQHMFGLMVLAEFFIREAWQVRGGPGFSADDAVDIARGDSIDVVGFSISSRGQVNALASCIRAIRRASPNPNLRVMVGGPLFEAQPGLVARVGADVAVSDAQAAVCQARGLLTPQRLAGRS